MNNLHTKKCTRWIKNAFKLKDADIITIELIKDDHQNHENLWTKIIVEPNDEDKKEFIIKKPLVEISKKDIQRLALKAKIERGKLHPLWGPLFRFLAWWFAFTGIYAMFSVCPFCGQPGCVVGAGSAGVVGGFFAFLLQFGKSFLNGAKRVIFKLVQK